MWEVTGIDYPVDQFDLEPVRILYEFDGPKIFVCHNAEGESHLAYQCGEDSAAMRFLVVPLSEDRERGLTTGEVNLRDTLLRTCAWIVDLNFSWKVQRSWCVDTDDLPTNVLPEAGVMLWPHLKPKIIADLPRSCTTETRTPSVFFDFLNYKVAIGAF